MNRKTALPLLGAVMACFILGTAALPAAAAQDNGARMAEQDRKRHAAALKVIQKNLDALGGAEAFRKIRSLSIEGVQGLMVLEPTDSAVYHLKKPGLLRRESGLDVIVCNGEKQVYDAGSGEAPLDPQAAANLDIMVPFLLGGLSLTAWDDHFDAARYLGKKKYGEHEEYVVVLHGAQDGRDLTVHFDRETFLIDRLVFETPHPRAKTLKNVWRLRDYREFDGLRMPTTLLLEKVGWKENGQQFLIRDVKVNPDLDDALFTEARLDLGSVKKLDDSLEGEVRSKRYGIMHSNVSDDDMAALGIETGQWVAVTVGAGTVKARYIKGYAPDPQAPQRETNLFCIHPQANFPCCLLLPASGTELGEDFVFETGDTVTVTPCDPDAPADQDETENSDGNDSDT